MTDKKQNLLGRCRSITDTAIICSGKDLSYDGLRRAVLESAKCLHKAGINRSDRVAIQSANSLEYIIVLLGLWRLKAVACPIHARLPWDAVVRQLNRLRVSRLITSDEFYPSAGSSGIKAERLSAMIASKACKKEGRSALEMRLPLDQDLTIMFSSGTSASPKAVIHTFGNHFYSALGSNAHIPVEPQDRWFLALPLNHVGGMSIIFRAFLGGAAVVISDRNQDIAEIFEGRKVTHLSLVPTQLYRMLKDHKAAYALSRLKAVLLGGSMITESLIESAKKHGVPVYASYGLTEMASQVATTHRLDSEEFERGLRILNHRQLKISPEGEILVKGEALCRGYLDDTGQTPLLDQDGWFATGDLGSYSEAGGLVVAGRKDNMFICGGENIQPEEVEEHLCRIEGIEEALVVPIADEEFGFRPAAFVKFNGDHAISSAGINAFLSGSLAKIKIPVAYLSWPIGLGQTNLKANRKQWIDELSRHAAETGH